MNLDFADVFFVVNLFDRIGHGIVGREGRNELDCYKLYLAIFCYILGLMALS